MSTSTSSGKKQRRAPWGKADKAKFFAARSALLIASASLKAGGFTEAIGMCIKWAFGADFDSQWTADDVVGWLESPEFGDRMVDAYVERLNKLSPDVSEATLANRAKQEAAIRAFVGDKASVARLASNIRTMSEARDKGYAQAQSWQIELSNGRTESETLDSLLAAMFKLNLTNNRRRRAAIK